MAVGEATSGSSDEQDIVTEAISQRATISTVLCMFLIIYNVNPPFGFRGSVHIHFDRRSIQHMRLIRVFRYIIKTADNLSQVEICFYLMSPSITCTVSEGQCIWV